MCGCGAGFAGPPVVRHRIKSTHLADRLAKQAAVVVIDGYGRAAFHAAMLTKARAMVRMRRIAADSCETTHALR
jgi:hypothetical protein